jgi:hypothetical protein
MKPWLPDLTNGVGSLAGLLVALALVYDLAGIVPGPMMVMALGLLVSGAPLGRAGKVWLQERREPAAQLPEVTAALELSALMHELGQGAVMRAVGDVARHRRSLPRGDDHAE